MNTLPLTEFISWVPVGLVVAIGTVLWWGINRMVKTQDAVAENMGKLAVEITEIGGTLKQNAQWQQQHEEKDVIRHGSNNSDIREMRDMVKGIIDRELTRVNHEAS